MLTKFDSKSNRVKGLSFHPKRPWIIASLHNGVLQLWDYRMGTLLEKYEEHEGPVRGVDFHYTQPLFVSGGDDYKIKVWNYKLRRCLFTLLGHLDYIRTVMFHHEHPWLVSASDDQTIRLWNWQSRTCISVLTGHNHYVMCAQFHPKEELIVSASLDQTVRVWDTTALSRKGTRSGPQTEDSSTSALGRAGRSMAAELFPTGGDVVVKYVLEGHDRGANWAAFHPTQSLIVSGADDRQVKLWRMSDSKAWEMDTLRGHTNNVSCVLFHTRHDLVISNSEDKSIRVWDTQKRTCVQTFRREQDRFWMLAAHPEQNLLAAGHDSGMVVFKLEKERPAFASSGNGALLYVRDRYLRQATLGSAKDLSLCALRGRPAGPFGGAPRGMTLNLFNPGEDNVLITFSADGGTYELYTLPAAGGAGGVSPSVAAAATSNQEPSRGAGMAAVFTARNKFAVLDKVARSIVVKGFTPGDVGKKVKPPYPNADFLFPSSTPGHVLVRAEDRLGLFDLQARKLMSELTGVTVKYVVWSADGNYVALLGKHAVLLADKQLTQICSTTETVRVKGGAWDEYGVFLYATLNHIKYLLPIPSGESGIVRTLEAPVYPVEARGGIMYALDRDTRVRAVPVDATEHTFKLALARRQYEKVLNIIKGAKLCGQAVIAYLQKAGCPEVALLFVEDEGTRFNLALQCGNLDIALRAAKSLNSEEAWLRLAGAAVSQGALDVAEAAYVTVKNLSRLSMLYHCVGAQEKLGRLAGVASRGDPTARFQMSLLTGDVGERVKALEAAGQISLAFVTANVGGLVEEAARLKSYLDTAKLAVPEIKASYQPLAPLKPTAPLASMRLPRAQAKSGPKGLDLKAIAAAAAAAGEAAAAPGGSGSLGAGAAERAASVASAAMASAAAAAKEEEAARVAAAKAAKAAGASGEDGEDGGWGDDDDLGEDGEGEEGGGEGAGEGGGWGDDEDIGLDELEVQQAAQAAERAAAAAAAAKAGASGGGKSGVWTMPAGGASPASLWVRNSILAGDHAAAGSYESAAQLLHRQIGIVNFNPLRPGFRAAFLAAKASMPTLPGLPSMSLAIQRGGLDSAPPREATLPASLVSLATLAALQTKVHAAFTEGKFTEVRDTVDTLFSVIPLCIAHTREEAEGVKTILTSATQYKVAVCCVQASRQGGEGDAKRQVELAAYATHCQLEPNHIILVLNLALTHAFKHKNFIHAAGFARRLIELPEASSAKNATFVSKAKTVLQKSESEARNAMTLDYDDRSSFHLCAGSLTPIAKGAPFVRSPYSAAYYKPEFKGTVCVVDGMSQVGVETIGLVCLQQKK